jgi:hypothetical protein
MENYTREQFWELYKKLPPELQDALFSEEVGNNTYDICVKNDIEDKLSDVVDCVGQVLTKVLPLEELTKKLEEITGEKELAEKIYSDLNQLIFSPIIDMINKADANRDNTTTESSVKSTTIKSPDTNEKFKEKSSSNSYREEID